MEGTENELLQHILDVPHRSRDVLFLQQAKGGRDVQGEPLSGKHHEADRAGQEI